jgi:hypothetical protein
MFAPITAPALALILVAAVDRMPAIDPLPACRDAAERAKPVGDIDLCMRKEMAARDELVKHWAEFSGSDKAVCVPLHTRGGLPTYTELITCLEVVRDARKAREKASSNSW